MKLSNRLTEIFNLIPDQARVADVGTDHGLLLIKAIQEHKASFGYGLDIAEKPLQQARENVERFGLKDKIELQLGNGLEGFQGDANCYVIAGMGAETIWSIISNYKFNENDTIIIQSNTKNAWLRQTVSEHGFALIDERFILEREIPVFIMVIKVSTSNQSALTQEDVLIGPMLKKQLNEDYRIYLTNRANHLYSIKKHNVAFEEEYNTIKNILEKEC
ncbi:SAM-dependent methyltransferase [Erysipelothrix piscisicarius]|uniref:SAM-dependent methyltransferase n=1 Tax=Erysipelothrix piscisicarius TaxID=2485784 RepID=A0A3S8RMY5_9FIRM|nr:class I SAM-dependent methyltransferase [Erysipelothrix piscisicarius]AZK44247.1 SAM-dependent methyltransferase [Erysipelothrix piscisicarius]